MTTTGAPMVPVTTTVDSSYKRTFGNNDDKETEYNIILSNKVYKICDQIIILQYIHSIISLIFVMSIIYVFYTILKNKKNI